MSNPSSLDLINPFSPNYRGRGGGGGRQDPQSELEAYINQFNQSGSVVDGNVFTGGDISQAPVQHLGPIPGVVKGQRDDRNLANVTTLLQAFYNLDQRELRRYQVLLFAGGFYGQMNIDDVQFGTFDDASFSAWATAVEQAARRLEAGDTGATVQLVINEAALESGMTLEDGAVPTPDQLAAQLAEDEGPTGEMIRREGDLISIMLSDPNELRLTMDNVASATLGRKANPAEQQMLIGFVHELQRKGQTAQQTAKPGEVWAHISEEDLEAAAMDPAAAMALDDSIPTPEDVTVEYAPPNPQAAAEQLLRQENPAEAGAHDISIQFANFMDMLQGPVSFQRQVYGQGGV